MPLCIAPAPAPTLTGTTTAGRAMAGRGGAARPNGPAAGNKICQFKLVLLGESAVGKSSLVLRFVKGQFHEYQESTIGGEWAQGRGWWSQGSGRNAWASRRRDANCPQAKHASGGSSLPPVSPGIESSSWSPCLCPNRHLVRII